MMDFMFFVKTFLLTVAIVLVMQIHVGERSVENHAMGWIQSSSIVSPLNSVAHGAAKLVRDLTASVYSKLSNTPNAEQAEANAKKEEKKSSSFRWTYGRSRDQNRNAN